MHGTVFDEFINLPLQLLEVLFYWILLFLIEIFELLSINKLINYCTLEVELKPVSYSFPYFAALLLVSGLTSWPCFWVLVPRGLPARDWALFTP